MHLSIELWKVRVNYNASKINKIMFRYLANTIPFLIRCVFVLFSDFFFGAFVAPVVLAGLAKYLSNGSSSTESVVLEALQV